MHADWDAARADYRRARRLDPEMDVVELCLGRLLLDQGKPAAARRTLDRFLDGHPDHREALASRARSLERLGRHLEAARDLTRAIASSRGPRLPEPDLYLERARVLVAAGREHLDEALRGLDEGLVALGPAVTLEFAAIDLEMGRRGFDAALGRLDRVAALSARKEAWPVKRGAILEAAGRAPEAKQAYAEALREMESLPAARRQAAAVLDIEEAACAGLERLGGRRGTPTPGGVEPVESSR